MSVEDVRKERKAEKIRIKQLKIAKKFGSNGGSCAPLSSTSSTSLCSSPVCSSIVSIIDASTSSSSSTSVTLLMSSPQDSFPSVVGSRKRKLESEEVLSKKLLISPYQAAKSSSSALSSPAALLLQLVCNLCPQKSQKRFGGLRGLREHINAKHSALGTETCLRTLEEAEQSINETSSLTNNISLPSSSLTSNRNSSSSSSSSSSSILSPLPNVLTETKRVLDVGLVAAQNGDLETLQKLVVEGWKPDTCDHLGSTALHWAAGSGHVNVVKYFLQELSVDPLSSARCGRKDGKTALHWAARNGKNNVVSYLLSLGVPVDVMTKDESTPLSLACFGGHLSTAQLLVEQKADISHRNKWQCAMSHWAAMGGHLEYVKMGQPG